MLNLADRAVAVDLLVEVLGNMLHQCAQRAIQDQVAVTCEGTQLMLGIHALERTGSKLGIADMGF